MLHRKRFGTHHRAHGNEAHASLYLICAMMLFWTLSEGIVSFLVPLRLEEAGFSPGMLGLIMGSSSVAGALFDLVAVKLFKDTYYKRIFAAMFVLCLLFPLILMQAAVPIVFLLGMVVWGIYYDLRNIGNYDYVARTSGQNDSSGHFGLIQVFQSVGWILGPLIVGFLVGEHIGWEPYAAIYLFLGIALLCFLGLVFMTKGKSAHPHKEKEPKECRRGIWTEAKLMGSVGKVLLPSLSVIFFLSLTDAFFWSIGPLFAEHLGLHGWAGIFMTAWSLPALLLGWFAAKFVQHHGKEKTALLAQGVSALFLIPLTLFGHPVVIIPLVFIAACFSAVAWPAIQGAFADYIKERRELDKEIESLTDLYTNLGYVFGPISAGFLAEWFGFGAAFGMLGILVACVSAFSLARWKHKLSMRREGPPLICDV